MNRARIAQFARKKIGDLPAGRNEEGRRYFSDLGAPRAESFSLFRKICADFAERFCIFEV
jgi:hypothetical protein